MNGKIVYDKPGRIRFRCGAYAFERELETAIQEALLRNRFVLQVEVRTERRYSGTLPEWTSLGCHPSGCKNESSHHEAVGKSNRNGTD